jgi:hypothetical protein
MAATSLEMMSIGATARDFDTLAEREVFAALATLLDRLKGSK